MSELWSFLLDAIEKSLDWISTFFTELLPTAFDAFLSVVATAIEAIPLPDFITGGLQTVMNALPADVLYFLAQTAMPQGLAILGAAYAFRFVRKAVTLFQW